MEDNTVKISVYDRFAHTIRPVKIEWKSSDKNSWDADLRKNNYVKTLSVGDQHGANVTVLRHIHYTLVGEEMKQGAIAEYEYLVDINDESGGIELYGCTSFRHLCETLDFLKPYIDFLAHPKYDWE